MTNVLYYIFEKSMTMYETECLKSNGKIWEKMQVSRSIPGSEMWVDNIINKTKCQIKTVYND